MSNTGNYVNNFSEKSSIVANYLEFHIVNPLIIMCILGRFGI